MVVANQHWGSHRVKRLYLRVRHLSPVGGAVARNTPECTALTHKKTSVFHCQNEQNVVVKHIYFGKRKLAWLIIDQENSHRKHFRSVWTLLYSVCLCVCARAREKETLMCIWDVKKQTPVLSHENSFNFYGIALNRGTENECAVVCQSPYSCHGNDTKQGTRAHRPYTRLESGPVRLVAVCENHFIAPFNYKLHFTELWQNGILNYLKLYPDAVFCSFPHLIIICRLPVSHLFR